ncbi:MAG: four helix bundle protein [Bacteroidetes bacterium]|nr:four helix bundle protein [Bacteroidota bacterium]
MEKRIENFKDLKVWQKSMDLVVLIYEFCADLPKEEKYGIISQKTRAAVSIVANIAEGHSRKTIGQFKLFLFYSSGSASEVETLALICQRLNYGNSEKIKQIISEVNQIQRMLTNLKKSLNNKL